MLGHFFGGLIPSDLKQALLLVLIGLAALAWLITTLFDFFEEREKKAAAALDVGAPQPLCEVPALLFVDVPEGTRVLRVDVTEANIDLQLRVAHFFLPGPRAPHRLEGTGALTFDAPEVGRWWFRVKNPSGRLQVTLVAE